MGSHKKEETRESKNARELAQGLEEVIEEEIVLDKEQRIGALEAVLFCAGSSVEMSRLTEYLNCSEEELSDALDALETRYKNKRSGLEILRLEKSIQLATKKDYYNVLRKMVGAPRKTTLTDTVLETLSIVAYKQPVTRVEIESIRGVSCGHQINRLLELDLIKELGRLDVPGKPLLFGTTETFLKTFRVSSIDDLPLATPTEIAEFQAEAEAEVQEVKV